jgi:hypothetical protein
MSKLQLWLSLKPNTKIDIKQISQPVNAIAERKGNKLALNKRQLITVRLLSRQVVGMEGFTT